MHKQLTIAMALAALATPAAWAGQECGDASKGPSPEIVAKAIRSAENTASYLNQSGDSVVMLARVGQDLSEYGLTYSHLAYAVKKDDGKWVVVHKLNECGTAKSDIYEQSLAQFYMDDLHRYQAGIWHLQSSVQERLKPQLLGSGSLRFHNPAYNMVAYPFNLAFQNSNGWVLEVLSSAIDPSIQSREQAVSWLQRSGYHPSSMKLNVFKRAGARATKSNITFEDHPSADRWAGRINVVTVDSVADFMAGVAGLCKVGGCPEKTLKND